MSPVQRKWDGLARVVTADGKDAYHRWLKYLLLPFFTLYGVVALVSDGITITEDTELVHIARESGLRMQLKEELPRCLLQAHAYCAIAMIILVVFQKHFIQSAVLELHSEKRQMVLAVHRIVGWALLCLTMGMDIAGYLMGPYASWKHFTTFEIVFAAPWIVICSGIYISASGIFGTRNLQLHRLFGNMLLKACIATPLARLSGAWLQRKASASPALNENGWNDENAYYVGIGFVAVVIGMWQICDIAAYLFWEFQGTVERSVECESRTKQS